MARILVADDTPQIIRLVTYKLRQKGHEVTAVADGLAAIEEARAHPPELCILDVLMPGADGYQVLRTLREDPQIRNIPVIMLTSLGDDSHVVRGLEHGANDYMVKPFSPSELLARVERLLAA